jgi:predicted nucleotidyltransferase
VLQIEELLRVLHKEQVDFVLLGGAAAILHGSSYVTKDIDLAFSRERENCNRLARALAPYSPRLRSLPPGLPFVLDAQALRTGSNFTLDTSLGEIDLLGEISGFSSYREIKEASEEIEAYGFRFSVLSLQGLIRTKRAAGRPKDLLLLPELEALQALKDKH